jgi:hypothetical protein
MRKNRLKNIVDAKRQLKILQKQATAYFFNSTEASVSENTVVRKQ